MAASARDPHQLVNELEPDAVARLVARLEGRARDAIFTSLFDKYLGALQLAKDSRVLEVGCGTAAMLRRLAASGRVDGPVYGVDQCAAFITTGASLAATERISDRIELTVGDAHRLGFDAASFDVVLAHTLLSHATDPAAVVGEMARVACPGARIVIFDGDYASLTYSHPDHAFGRGMDAALAEASFANPRIMRDLPRLLPAHGLELEAGWGDAVVEIGGGSYFRSFAETYAPYVAAGGLLPESSVDAWLAQQRDAMARGVFFAACTYYTYIATRR